jgi:hypothetical protein
MNRGDSRFSQPARKRRAVLLEELRQELAPVVQWFAEQDDAARHTGAGEGRM